MLFNRGAAVLRPLHFVGVEHGSAIPILGGDGSSFWCILSTRRAGVTRMADQEIIFTVEDAPEGGYTARALGYAIFTQGETLEELRQMVRDAVNCHFEKENKPRLIRLHSTVSGTTL